MKFVSPISSITRWNKKGKVAPSSQLYAGVRKPKAGFFSFLKPKSYSAILTEPDKFISANDNNKPISCSEKMSRLLFTLKAKKYNPLELANDNFHRMRAADYILQVLTQTSHARRSKDVELINYALAKAYLDSKQNGVVSKIINKKAPMLPQGIYFTMIYGAYRLNVSKEDIPHYISHCLELTSKNKHLDKHVANEKLINFIEAYSKEFIDWTPYDFNNFAKSA